MDGDLLERLYDIAPDSDEYERVMMGSNEFERIGNVAAEKELLALLEQVQALSYILCYASYKLSVSSTLLCLTGLRRK